MQVFQVGDTIRFKGGDDETGKVTRVEDVPNHPDDGRPQIEVDWGAGYHQYWPIDELEVVE